jgi:hypothetical protein
VTNTDYRVQMSLTLGLQEFGLRFVVLKFPYDEEKSKELAVLFEEFYDEDTHSFKFVLRSIDNARFRYRLSIRGGDTEFTY